MHWEKVDQVVLFTIHHYFEIFLFFSVNRWEEPFDSTVYCVRTDGIYSLLTGTATYGMTRLWDKRMSAPVKVGTAYALTWAVHSDLFLDANFHKGLCLHL